MCRVVRLPTWHGVVLLGIFFSLPFSSFSTESREGDLVVQSVHGRGAYSVDQMNWAPLVADVALPTGAIVRTEPGSSVDIISTSSGTALRLIPGSLLEITKLEKQVAGEDVITKTVLNLRAGGLIGAQRKLQDPSSFQITTLAGAVTIHGTEYLVLANGTVRSFAGEIWINDLMRVPSGFSFDPATRLIAAIEPGLITAVVADMDAIHQVAQGLKKESGQMVMTSDNKLSPTKGSNGVGHGAPRGRPPGNPPINNGPGTGPGNPGNKGGTPGHT